MLVQPQQMCSSQNQHELQVWLMAQYSQSTDIMQGRMDFSLSTAYE